MSMTQLARTKSPMGKPECKMAMIEIDATDLNTRVLNDRLRDSMLEGRRR